MRQGGDLGEMVGAMRSEVVPPLIRWDVFGMFHGHVLPHDRGQLHARERPHSSELTVRGIDPTATSVVTCSEGFRQGSGEK